MDNRVYPCPHSSCGKICRSKGGLTNHQNACPFRPLQHITPPSKPIPPKSRVKPLPRHSKTHTASTVAKDASGPFQLDEERPIGATDVSLGLTKDSITDTSNKAFVQPPETEFAVLLATCKKKALDEKEIRTIINLLHHPEFDIEEFRRWFKKPADLPCYEEEIFD